MDYTVKNGVKNLIKKFNFKNQMEEMIIVDGPNDALNNGNLFNNGFVLEGMEVNENKLEGKKI